MMASITYDGTAQADAIQVALGAGDGSALLTTEFVEVGGEMWRSYTLWLGLAHDYFAPSGRPARHGNLVTLLRDGEEAWATVQADLLLAQTLITAATWWWTSELELFRDPVLHPFLSSEERWKETALGALASVGLLNDVESKVLVNQFYSQDGLLSWVTSDDWLYDAAITPGDGIEMLGVANEVSGVFEVYPAGAAFADHVIAGWEFAEDTELLGVVESEPWLEPQTVDMTELPAGLGLFDVPLASWHQKFLTVDQEVAYIGGMNIKTTDWDTHEHRVYEERRMSFEATAEARFDVMDKAYVPDFGPRKDYMVRIEGPSVIDAVDVFKQRWDTLLTSGVDNAELATSFAQQAPPSPFATGVQAQVVTTMPPPFDENSIVDTMLRAIARADDYIYIEDQYFRAPILADAIVDRMLVDQDLVLIVVTKPVDEWLDPGCWQTHLQHQMLEGLFPERYGVFQLRNFDWVDTGCFLCLDEVLGTFQAVDTHSKLAIIDDVYLQAGSCNHNNRGLLYEGEAAVAVVDEAWVTSARGEVLSNVLEHYYDADATGAEWLVRFRAAATWNDSVYGDWEWEGFDLHLDGEPLPEFWQPRGFVYSLDFGAPSDCFFEAVGEDVTQAL
ncbi:MAG: phospholipase D-like domain-containing protein [Myxococcota bacterium]|nr:phospholipase D-like domain-containing protein [Myxococcota bacterium]